jgi:hypothetical protein
VSNWRSHTRWSGTRCWRRCTSSCVIIIFATLSQRAALTAGNCGSFGNSAGTQYATLVRLFESITHWRSSRESFMAVQRRSSTAIFGIRSSASA